ncbi:MULTISPECIES: cell wall metabolism sensor histidine kinase WalK [unclassified Micromonospora]|uniref:sensor histidine kinase n=1 Tax=unclassified Micromonospora TaxID=2617518 RepID=UPI000EF46326|nr:MULTISPECIES: ATP-binding protein [unclassified Micromonospora]RLP91775.1 two-component sensor histidine kinase [Micromonospora sp. BL4]RLP96831.1 two-component sensor histidine kinase [Micromonospora sp. CV4]
MEWAVAVVVAVALVAGLAAGFVLPRFLPARRRPSTSTGSADSRWSRGRPAIADEQQTGLGRRTIDSLRAGVVVLDDDDTPVLINPAARAMGLLRTGSTPGSIAAHPLIRTLAGQVRRTGVRREIELDLPRGRDSAGENPLGVHLRAMGLGNGFIAVEAVDVTESHRLTRVRRDFVANVSHELKTPIGALQLLAEALLDATEPAEAAAPDLSEDLVAARRFAERIQHESTRLGRLVQELLELTRLQGAEPQPPAEPVALDWVIAEVVDRTRTAASARGVEVSVTGQRGLTAYGSDTQLATAVANLVENAINYSGADTTVRVTLRGDDEHIDIAVADQGIGIAPTDVDRIFERFYRADQARSRATGGTGLGLAIVKHIASNHGGRVEVSSTLGGGSTFTLRLPARPPDDLLATLPPAGIEAGPAELRQV